MSPKKLPDAQRHATIPRHALTEGYINERKAHKMILDSGCTMTLVHPRHLPNDYKKTGYVQVKGARQEKNIYPTTETTIEVEEWKTKTTVGVNAEMDWDAILGLELPASRALLAQRMTAAAEDDQKEKETDQAESETETKRKKKEKEEKRTSSTASNTSSTASSTDSTDDSGNKGPPRRRRPRRRCARKKTYHFPSTSPSSSQSHSSTASSSEGNSDDSEGNSKKRSTTRSSEKETETSPSRQRKKVRRRHLRWWGPPAPLEGGKAQLTSRQETDPTLEICRRHSAQEGRRRSAQTEMDPTRTDHSSTPGGSVRTVQGNSAKDGTCTPAGRTLWTHEDHGKNPGPILLAWSATGRGGTLPMMPRMPEDGQT